MVQRVVFIEPSQPSFEQREEAARVLSILFSSLCVYDTKLKCYSLNLRSEQFIIIRECLEKMSVDMCKQARLIAISIRTLGFAVPGASKEFLDLSLIKEIPGEVMPQITDVEMLKDLLAGAETLIKYERTLEVPLAERQGLPEIADLLRSSVRCIGKYMWILRSHVKTLAAALAADTKREKTEAKEEEERDWRKDKKIREVFTRVNHMLANQAIMLAKCRNFEINMVGQHTFTLQKLLKHVSRMYCENMTCMQDHIRSLEFPAVCTWIQWQQQSHLSEMVGREVAHQNQRHLIKLLVDDLDNTRKQYVKFREEIDHEFDDRAAVDMFDLILRRNDEVSWLLRSHLPHHNFSL